MNRCRWGEDSGSSFTMLYAFCDFWVILRNSSIASVLLQCSGDTRIAPSISRASTILLEYMLLLKRSNTVTP